jgi:hypothetical protein
MQDFVESHVSGLVSRKKRLSLGHCGGSFGFRMQRRSELSEEENEFEYGI